MTKSPELSSSFSCIIHEVHPSASPDTCSERQLARPTRLSTSISYHHHTIRRVYSVSVQNPAELAKITFVVVFIRYFTYFSLCLLDIGI